MGPGPVGQAFQPAGSWGFLAPRVRPGGWKVAGTGRLESLPYLLMRTAAMRRAELDGNARAPQTSFMTVLQQMTAERLQNCERLRRKMRRD